MNVSSKFILALIFVFFFNAFSDAFAAQVAAVKGKQVLIIGDNLEKGSLYFVVIAGKKKGIVKVLNIKGRKALANLLKGTAAKGATLVFRPSKSKASSQVGSTRSTAPESSSEKSTEDSTQNSTQDYGAYSDDSKPKYSNESGGYKASNKKMRGVGLMLAYQMNKADIDFAPPAGSGSLSGSGIGFKLLGDYEFTKTIHLRGEFGTVPFNAEGGNQCAGGCKMAINYLGGTLWARYMFGDSSQKTRFWGGANASLIFPLGTGNTNAVNVDDVGSTLIFGFGGGFDYRINDKYYIPFSAEYTMFPPNDEVSASIIQVKAGLGMRL